MKHLKKILKAIWRFLFTCDCHKCHPKLDELERCSPEAKDIFLRELNRKEK